MSKVTPSRALYDEFEDRINHVAEILIGVKSKQGNFGLILQHGISKETLAEMAKLINEELEELEGEGENE